MHLLPWSLWSLMTAQASALRATWHKAPAGPSARSGACAAADGAGGAFLFGGYIEQEDMSRSVTNDLWRFDGEDWSLVAPAGPDTSSRRRGLTPRRLVYARRWRTPMMAWS